MSKNELLDFSLPYFDQVLDELSKGDPEYAQAWGRHAHWGYWPDPTLATGTVDDFERAADEFSRRHFLAANVKNGTSILDVGCGFGGTIGLLNTSYSQLRLCGVNIDPRQISRANELITPKATAGNSIEFKQGNAISLPYEGASFDTVFALECIFHFPSRELFMAEAFRVLKPGGRLIVSDFVATGWSRPLLDLGTKLSHAEIAATSGTCLPLISVKNYQQMAEACGFKMAASENITRQSLPTTPIFLHLLNGRGDFAERMAKVYIRMRNLMRWRMMEYWILSFEKNN